MSIGIYDADIAQYMLVPFNLEAMKLSAYYKKQREIVLLAKDFDPSRNSKFFYIKDWDDGNFPSSLSAHNVSFLGHAFSGSKYVPLNEEIEMMRPDTSIYTPLAPVITEYSTQAKNIFNSMSSAEHIRLSLDGKTIWPQYKKQFNDLEHTKLLMIHDYDLAQIDNSFNTVKSILNECKKYTKLGIKFPPRLTQFEDLMNWSSFNSHGVFYSMGYEGLLPIDQFIRWCAAGYNKSSYAILEYNITPAWFAENDFTEDYLRQIFTEIIISRSYRLKISLIYDDNFVKNNNLKKLLNLFNFYQHSMMSTPDEAFIREIQSDTLYDFAHKSLTTYGRYPKMYTKDEMRQIFYYVGQNYPNLFKDLYELNYLRVKEEYYDAGRY